MKNDQGVCTFNPLNAESNPICYLLALLGAQHFLHVSRIRVKDGIEIRKKCVHLIHRSDHNDDDDDSYDNNNNDDEYYYNNKNSFVRSCVHSFKDLSTVL